MDPRRFDLHQMLAAFEAALRQAAKDESAWNRTRGELYAEPRNLRQRRRAASATGGAAPPQHPLQRGVAGSQPSGRGRTLEEAEALISQITATDARYGT